MLDLYWGTEILERANMSETIRGKKWHIGPWLDHFAIYHEQPRDLHIALSRHGDWVSTRSIVTGRDTFPTKAAALEHARKHADAADQPAGAEASGCELPLLGEWRHGGGYLCCGTLRVARESFDTDPAEEFKTEVLDWMCKRLNERHPTALENHATEDGAMWLTRAEFEALRNVLPGKPDSPSYALDMAVKRLADSVGE